MNVIAIIPAYESAMDIHYEMTMDFCGKPLIAWSILQALECKAINKVYVFSDSDAILKITRDYGAIGIKQPVELVANASSCEPALIHALIEVEGSSDQKVDFVVFLQAASPLRESEDITKSLKEIRDKKADSLFSCTRLEGFFVWQETNRGLISLDYDYKNRIKKQNIKPQYIENGSIYIFKPEILKKHVTRLGGKIITLEMDFWKTWKINALEDKALCEWYFERYLLKKWLKLSKNDIDLIVYDFDGVMTDNKVLTLQDGTEAILANRSDGLAVDLFKKSGIPQIILSTESNPVVEARARKIGLPVIYKTKNKLSALKKYCSQYRYDLSRVVYVGNDINDLESMKAVGIPIAPSNAHFAIKRVSKIILKSSGGEGVARELADLILLK